ncbi:hypothetical protein A3Q56_07882 [Intoshia linei]|uniref:PID domain-containing protein n=1 Tax=Intoshia linei TaxID=1819745 RepID=A0A177AQY5_9BILA|nr:hypothetical protein A3Q56_07882 [Intoshia linei]
MHFPQTLRIKNLFTRKKSLILKNVYYKKYKICYIGNMTINYHHGIIDPVHKSVNTLLKAIPKSRSTDMKLLILPSQLSAQTKEQGTTIWNYNRMLGMHLLETGKCCIFWIYKHVDKKMRQIIRLHVAFCPNESTAVEIVENTMHNRKFASKIAINEKIRRDEMRRFYEHFDLGENMCIGKNTFSVRRRELIQKNYSSRTENCCNLEPIIEEPSDIDSDYSEIYRMDLHQLESLDFRQNDSKNSTNYKEAEKSALSILLQKMLYINSKESSDSGTSCNSAETNNSENTKKHVTEYSYPTNIVSTFKFNCNRTLGSNLSDDYFNDFSPLIPVPKRKVESNDDIFVTSITNLKQRSYSLTNLSNKSQQNVHVMNGDTINHLIENSQLESQCDDTVYPVTEFF